MGGGDEVCWDDGSASCCGCGGSVVVVVSGSIVGSVGVEVVSEIEGGSMVVPGADNC